MTVLSIDIRAADPLALFAVLFFVSGLAFAGAAEDEKVVAALDTQYQAAVAKNDAAGMEKILADDFVLVTGRGKAFTKADLLAEARGGTRVYERQEETTQKVRVYGDAAVVTALLWCKGTDQESRATRGSETAAVLRGQLERESRETRG